MEKPKNKWKKYILNDKNVLVYYGITSRALSEREDEHKNNGLQFTRMVQKGYSVSKGSALEWEKESVRDYCEKYKKNPKYNDYPKCKE